MATLRHTSGTVMSRVSDESVKRLISMGWKVHEPEVAIAKPTVGADDAAEVGDAPADVEVEPKVEQAPRRHTRK